MYYPANNFSLKLSFQEVRTHLSGGICVLGNSGELDNMWEGGEA